MRLALGTAQVLVGAVKTEQVGKSLQASGIAAQKLGIFRHFFFYLRVIIGFAYLFLNDGFVVIGYHGFILLLYHGLLLFIGGSFL